MVKPSDPCEFDPATNGGATRASGCPNQAEIIVGAGGRWRVCSSCAALPYFDLLRKRVPITVRRLFVDACDLVERGIEAGAVIVTSR